MKVKGLNDAKYIAVMVYVVTIVLAITLVSTFVLTDYINIYPAIYCVGLAISGMVTLALTFIPKVHDIEYHVLYQLNSFNILQMVMLCKDPNGEKVFSKNEEKAKQVSTMLEGTPLGENETDNLKQRIKQLEDIVAGYKVGTSHNT